MKIVITGATGFIGPHLLEALGKQGHRLSVITRRQAAFASGIEVVQGDISDAGSIEQAFAGADVLIHMAAEIKDESRFFSANVTGVQNLCELVNKYQLKKVIHLSSVGVQGVQFSLSPKTVTENETCDPKNGYEKTKLESEKIWKTKLNKATQLTILRPTNVFGEDHPRKALLNLMQKVAAGNTFYADKNAMVNYVYVKDLVEVMVHFVQHNDREHINTYNVGAAMKLDDFLRAIAANHENRLRIRHIPQWLYKPLQLAVKMLTKGRLGQVKSLFNKVIYDDSLLMQQTKYTYGTVQGLKNTIEDYRNKKLLK